MSKRASPLSELLSGSAHEPVVTDVTVPIGERFAGKGILAVVIAKERGVVVRVHFDAAGRAQLTGVRQVENRSRDLGALLQSEAKAMQTQSVMLCIGLGWAIERGVCSTRRDQTQGAFERYRLLQDTPEAFLPGAKTSCLYAAVDHPKDDQAMLFSLQRGDVIRCIEDIRKAGLQVVGVRCLVASLLEVWLARKGADALKTDLLFSDGMSAALLNVQDGDFAQLKDSSGADIRPRQSTGRPNNVLDDMAQYVGENKSKNIVYLGPIEAIESLKTDVEAQGGTFELPSDPIYRDAVLACFAPETRHDFTPEMVEERPRIPRSRRKWILLYMVMVAVCVLVVGYQAFAGFSVGMDADNAEQRASQSDLRESNARAAIDATRKELVEAERTRQWIWGNYHAEDFLLRIIQGVPRSASIEKLTATLESGSAQMKLSFTLLGSEPAQQEECTRAIENALIDAGLKIGSREYPVQSGRTIMYTWNLILPSKGSLK